MIDILGLIDCALLERAIRDAKLTTATYKDFEPPEDWEWKVIEAKKLGLGDGLFYNVFEGPNGEKVIGFRGTENGSDWLTNVLQMAGLIGNQYYEVKFSLGALAEKYPDASVVGHSLGGGLASAFGTIHERQTTTYNSAGLHWATQLFFGINRKEAKNYVNAHYVDGDVLSRAQDKTGMERFDITPNALGNRFEYSPDLENNNKWNPLLPIDLHAMAEMIEALQGRYEECCK